MSKAPTKRKHRGMRALTGETCIECKRPLADSGCCRTVGCANACGYCKKPKPGLAALARYFAEEDTVAGQYGDDKGWNPIETAIHFLRERRKLRATW